MLREGYRESSSTRIEGLFLTLTDLAEPELEQMPGFEFTPGPTVSLLEFNSHKVLYFVESAVYYPGLAAIRGKLQRYYRAGLNRFFYFKANTRRGYVFQNSPFALGGFVFCLPLNFDKVCAKFPVVMSLMYHN